MPGIRRETPPYLQVAAHFRDEIRSGRLTPGDRLPTVRDIAAEFGCWPSTVHRAKKVLLAEGLIETRSKRSIVKTQDPPPQAVSDPPRSVE